MVRILFFGLLLYIFYKLLVDFIIPVFKTTRQVKKQFRDMHQRMNQTSQKQDGIHPNNPSSSIKKPVGDYIDFEEIK